MRLPSNPITGLLLLSFLAVNAQLLVPNLAQSHDASVDEAALALVPVRPAPRGKAIPGCYVAVLKETVGLASAVQTEEALRNLHFGASVEAFGFDPSLRSTTSVPPSTSNPVAFPRGFILKNISPFDILKMRRMTSLEFIEQDQLMHTTRPLPLTDVGFRATDGDETQDNPPWGLARVSHQVKPDFDRVDDYVFYKNDGLGVDVYVVDTGINIKHVEFEGRAIWGATIPDNDKDEDGNGHGTHCAGTIAGKTFGVAKMANVVAVKVLRSNGSGSMSDVLKGIEWVAREHIEKNEEKGAVKKGRTGNKKSVANMSLGGGKSEALDRAVDGAVSVGVYFAVAAGNDNADACKYSPAASKKAITVLATNIEDSRASFSNWGKCVDIGAPGQQILSSWIGSPTANNTISGTSMASPHVAGVVAAYVSRVDSGWDLLTPDELKRKLVDVSVKNVIKGMPKLSGTKNRLIFNGAPAHEHEDIKVTNAVGVKKPVEEDGERL